MEQVLMHDTQRWLAPRAAWLVARDGVLWVTRSGDPEDHVLRRGERLSVARGDDLVVGSWHRGQRAVWAWQPVATPGSHLLRPALPAWAWARAARALRGAADALAALARSAAARASRAQGCIIAGDSIASAGTVQ
jgi:Protein of unknown function (DUF2917)